MARELSSALPDPKSSKWPIHACVLLCCSTMTQVWVGIKHLHGLRVSEHLNLHFISLFSLQHSHDHDVITAKEFASITPDPKEDRAKSTLIAEQC